MSGMFKHHLNGVFDTGSRRIPQWLLDCQRAALEQIALAGMSDQLSFTLSGFKAGEERIDEPFEVFIVGEGKHGKSTLINALLGCSIAPTDRLPKTWCFNRYIAMPTPDPNVRLCVRGSLKKFPHLDATLGPQVREVRGLAEYYVAASVAEQIVQEEEARWTAAQSTGYISPIMEIEWQVSAHKALLPGLRLVDTQGIGQIHSDYEHRHYLKWQYERADAVLWLLAQDKIGASTTDEEINAARRYAKPVILILNKWDEIKGDPQRQLQRAQELYGSRVNAIVPFSALEAFLSVEPQGYEYQKSDYKRLERRKGNTWSDLRIASGLDQLVEVFQRLVWSKASLIRNAQIYSAARRKQSEYRLVMIRRKDEIQSNLHQYFCMIDAINKANSDNHARVAHGFNLVLKEALQTIAEASVQITWANKDMVRSLLQLDSISTHILQQQTRLAQQCTYRFAEVVTQAHSTGRYTTSEAATDGNVAHVAQIFSMADPLVTVAPVTMDWQVEIPSDFWDVLSRGVRWVAGFFSEAARKSLEDEDQKIRERVKALCTEQLYAHVEHAVKSFDTPIRTVDQRLRADLEQHLKKLGGLTYLQNAIPQIESALRNLAIPPVFVAVPMKIMRQLEWPQSDEHRSRAVTVCSPGRR